MMDNRIRALKELTRGKCGERRKAILRYIKNRPGVTAYQIAKEIYPKSVELSYKAARIQLKKLSELKDNQTGESFLLVEKQEDGVFHYSLAPDAERLCKVAGITLPAHKGEELVNGLNGFLKEPLSQVLKNHLRELIPPDVMTTLFEISDKCQQEYQRLSGLSVNDDIKRAFLAVWMYEAEEAFKDYKSVNKTIFKFASEMFGSRIGKLARKDSPRSFSILDKRMEKYLIAVPIIKRKPKEVKQKIDKLSRFLEQLAKENPTLQDIRASVQTAHGTRIGIALFYETLQKGRGG